MKILLAGPGTGKTTKIKKIISSEYPSAKNIRVISFTNATVDDLDGSFSSNPNISCSTLHSLAFKLNHLPDLSVISKDEEKIISSLSKKVNIDFVPLCEYLKCITYRGMIQSCVAFIQVNPIYVAEIIGKLELLVVDEFQDFNPDEQELIMELSKLSAETIIMGDDDQSIYDFKDADPEGIIRLYNDSGIEKIAHENICYRCPDKVVDFCTELLSHNKNRIDKVWQKNSVKGDVHLSQSLTQIESDNYIFSKIKSIIEIDPSGSILVLSPWGDMALAVKEKLKNGGINFVDCWSPSLSKEVTCRIWWLNSIYGKNKLSYLLFLLKHHGHLTEKRLIELLINSFHNDFNEQKLIADILLLNYLPEVFVSYVKTPPALTDFFELNKDYDSLKEYIGLDSIEKDVKMLSTNAKEMKHFEKGKVNFMSIFKSKGLEADYVIINGLVSGIIPNEDKGQDSIEAQRRLLFVGMSRAMKELFLVSTIEWEGSMLSGNLADKKQFKFIPYKRKWYGKTSKFIEEVVAKKTEKVEQVVS